MSTVARWFIAGAPLHARYPCRCTLGRRCNTDSNHPAYRCPCYGRTDPQEAHCCGRAHPIATTQEPTP